MPNAPEGHEKDQESDIVFSHAGCFTMMRNFSGADVLQAQLE